MMVSKYNANGNDFVIFHTLKKIDRSELAKKLCDRQNGIGADGLIVILPHDKYDFEWQFYNNDGSEASMCGNGSRACAHYAYSNSLADAKMSFLTGAGLIHAQVDGDVVETQLTTPKTISEPFEKEGKTWHLYDTGVPHLVTYVEDLESEWDLELIRKMRYEYNANVNFVKLGNPLKVRTYERGVEAETLACGTGMAASFLGAFKNNLIGSASKIIPTGGDTLEMRIEEGILYFKGAVKHVFDASI